MDSSLSLVKQTVSLNYIMIFCLYFYFIFINVVIFRDRLSLLLFLNNVMIITIYINATNTSFEIFLFALEEEIDKSYSDDYITDFLKFSYFVLHHFASYLVIDSVYHSFLVCTVILNFYVFSSS